ncbi:MAG TPA: DUF4383 domain-containing protein [Candidatus Acidoferrales bacterium]|jgi:hypothetical protein
MGRTYAIVVGFVLLVVGIIGFVEGDKMMMGLHFNLIHNCIHVVSGLVGLVAGLAGGQKGGRAFAQVFGVVYTIVAIVGFAGAPVYIVTMLNLDIPMYNYIHVSIGVLGLLAGFLGGSASEAAA